MIREETDSTLKAVSPQFLKKKRRFNLRYRHRKGPDLVRMVDLIREKIPGRWKRNEEFTRLPPKGGLLYLCPTWAWEKRD